MLLDDVAARRVVFVGGKGGVGKTTLAAAFATRLAAAGKRVLLVSTDPAHNLGHLFGRSLGDEPTALNPRLEAIELDPAATARRHVAEVEKTMHALMPEHLHQQISKHLQLAVRAPGTHESAILERIAEITERTEHYDLIIFDTAPSGHTARLMELPQLMGAFTDGLLEGREKSDRLGAAARGLDATVRDHSPTERRNQRIRSILHRRKARFERLSALLTDSTRCGFVLVLTPERMPVQETAEFRAELREEGVGVLGLVVNRLSPQDQGAFLAQRRGWENEVLAVLDELVPDLPRTELELVTDDLTDPKAFAAFAAQL
ncbi:arsenic-transporting ATPase [Corynebacterium yudongzhengii]|uniref:Arsenic-transporting ATPase n=1 Tax=Corynebacterium yudongzhengii TaxID=2080740 RepID=A0A2U1T5Z4_9CORY|nr:ArsA family ATPase [Corynebacterium yudongzhengii]AWB82624.1 arsenic-transporting ATPase [Corynebacterium yudongzhengii]PWC01412.1 arsenic-transporting ATPase [Corynebacterium yudongzhengii]